MAVPASPGGGPDRVNFRPGACPGPASRIVSLEAPPAWCGCSVSFSSSSMPAINVAVMMIKKKVCECCTKDSGSSDFLEISLPFHADVMHILFIVGEAKLQRLPRCTCIAFVLYAAVLLHGRSVSRSNLILPASPAKPRNKIPFFRRPFYTS